MTDDQPLPDLPIGANLLQGGMSIADAAELEVEIKRRMVLRVKRRALSDDADERTRYALDHQYRERFHRELLTEILQELQFERTEMVQIQKGLGLSVVPPDETPASARVWDHNGVAHDYVVERDAENGAVLARDQRTGDLSILREDATIESRDGKGDHVVTTDHSEMLVGGED